MQTTLTREQAIPTLCRLAAEQVSVNPAEVTVDTHLFSDLNFDSLDAVEFTMTVEDEFDVSIPDSEAEKVRTVRDALDLLFTQMPALGG